MNNGIQPTVELATNNGSGFYPYPMMYGNGGGFGGNGFLGGDGWIVLLLLLAFGGWGGNNGNGSFFGNNGFDNGYAWLSNGQKEIMQNTNNGFDTLHLSNQLEGNRDAINSLSNALCSSTASINSNISNGFFTAETAACNRQIASMNQDFTNQLNLQNNLNQLNSRFSDCCCENRLANCQTQNIIQNEGNATRFADANNTRDIITNATQNTQAILDKLCQLELDGKQDRINELERQVLIKDLAASQAQQTTDIVNNTYARLRDCPIDSTPIYGRIPIFTCNGNNGCGCGYNTTSQFI